MNHSIFEHWKFASEGNALDFKKMEYKFIKASDQEKGELLKDILAMANSWSQEDRYIVMGIEEKQEKPNVFHGIKEQIDDARIQQFVNSKTSRVCKFEYFSYLYKDRNYGIIRIPVQERPIFLRKDFGGLKSNTVYVRRGSSTAIANPDEMKEMGVHQDSSFPKLEASFYCKESGKANGNEIGIQMEKLFVTDDIPDYREIMGIYGDRFLTRDVNRDYYRDMVKYSNYVSAYYPVRIALTNNGNLEAVNIKIEISITNAVDIILNGDEPDKPIKANILIGRILKNRNLASNKGYAIEKYGENYFLTNEIESLHAKRTIQLDGVIYISANETSDILWKVALYYDGAEKPILQKMKMQISLNSVHKEWKEVKEKYIEDQN